MAKLKINEVQRQAPSKSDLQKARTYGFIYGKMDINVQADQVSKMKATERWYAEAKKKGNKAAMEKYGKMIGKTSMKDYVKSRESK